MNLNIGEESNPQQSSSRIRSQEGGNTPRLSNVSNTGESCGISGGLVGTDGEVQGRSGPAGERAGSAQRRPERQRCPLARNHPATERVFACSNSRIVFLTS